MWGSRKLIKILNHFGVVSSTDTHDRFMTQVATDQRSKSVWDYLPKSTLTLASADNFDMLQSHARVYHGDQSRSFHAVTVQITQPNPKECLMESCAPSTKRTLVSSPSNSPHKLGKIGPKRHRTLTPRNLCEQIQAAKINQVPKNNRDSNYPTRQPVSLTIDKFFEEPIEKSQRESLEFKLLAYCFTKEQLLNQPNKLLQEFKDLYAYSTQGSTCKSNIYYMELIDENPDSTETMRQVAELLLGSLNSDYQEDYVILIGDGKTYQHLMELKTIYGILLEKLLIFPGDWHIMANIQPVLMKIYYHAGLKELAQISGFKGETLTSLEKCSNFKRTHQFLIQVWQALFRAMIKAFLETNHHLHLPDIEISEDDSLCNLLNHAEFLLRDSGFSCSFKEFDFSMSDADDVWKFWQRFLFNDCLCYIQLYLAIRCQNWDLRNSALKLMAPVMESPTLAAAAP